MKNVYYCDLDLTFHTMKNILTCAYEKRMIYNIFLQILILSWENPNKKDDTVNSTRHAVNSTRHAVNSTRHAHDMHRTVQDMQQTVHAIQRTIHYT